MALDALAWYATVQLAAVGSFPLVARALMPLDDRGWAVSKIAGVLGLAWLTWFVGSIAPIPLTRATIGLALVAVALIAWARIGRRDDLVGWMRARVRLIVALEITFLVAFLAFLVLRAYVPAIAGTEKPMDMAFLNGFASSDRLPAQDPWLAGYDMPHYYFGWFVHAVLIKLSGVSAAVGYNLAVATIPALLTVSLAALGWSVARMAAIDVRGALVAAALAPLLVVVAGNLSAPLELLVALGVLGRDAGHLLAIDGFAEGVQPGVWPPTDYYWWWRASRVIPNIAPDGINEFPFFSAFLGDLHPHFMALMFAVVVLSVVAALILGGARTVRSPWTHALAALGLGAMLAGNTWDVLVFWPVFAVAAWWAGNCVPRVRRVALGLVAPIVAVLGFAPYVLSATSPPLGLGIVDDATPLGSFATLFLPQMLVLAAFGVWLRGRLAERADHLVAVVWVAMGILLMLVGQGTLGLLVSVLAVLVPGPALLRGLGPAAAFVVGLAVTGTLLLVGVELVFIDDAFGSRMNTVFKLHYSAWLLLGLAAAVAAAMLLGSARRVPRWGARALVTTVVVVGLVYPISAIGTRLASPPALGPTLDGLGFLSADEASAIAWLHGEVAQRRPVVAEAVSGEYSLGGRMATYSGAVAVLGWPLHEVQWRGPIPEIARREADIAALYGTTDSATQRDILDRYAVDFVVVGDLEREVYGEGVDTAFSSTLPVAFSSSTVVIYDARAAAAFTGERAQRLVAAQR